VVGFGTDGVGVAGGDDRFQVDGTGLLGDLIQHLLAFGLQSGLVEVEEGVGVQDDLAGGRGNNGRFGDGLAAAFSGGGRRPECIAPAVFAARVFPDMAVDVGPVVGRRSGTD